MRNNCDRNVSFNGSRVNNTSTNDRTESLVHLSLYSTLADLRGDIAGRMNGRGIASPTASRRSSPTERRQMIVSIIDEALSIVNEIDIERMLNEPDEASDFPQYSSQTDSTTSNGQSNSKGSPSE